MAAPRVRLETSIDPMPFGKYLLLDRVATGRLGSVHRAVIRRDGKPDERFAIKRFTPELSQDRRFTERAARVLSRAAQIKHPAHCVIAEVDRADDTLYAALEWVSGSDLKRIAAALRERGETMPAALVAYVGGQIAEVLAEAHGLLRAGKPAPLLHGELSAVDILIGFDGSVRLIGLGSAELAVAAQVEATRTAYHAPEIGLGAACSAQTDVFSLGACMLQALSLKSATDSKSGARRAESQITQIIPRALKQIVDRALAMQPEARWQSAAELAHQLQSWRSTQTQPADASALSAFMRGVFDGVRDDEERTRPGVVRPTRPEPGRHAAWDGVAEHTPAHGVLMQQLAADMIGRAQPVRDAEVSGTKSILEAIVNPEEEELELEPEPEAQAPQPQTAVDGWDDAPWEAEATSTAFSVVAQPVVRAQSSAVAAPTPAIHVPAQSMPTPAPIIHALAPTPAPSISMPAQPSPTPMLEHWQTERRAAWLVPSLIAATVLGLVLVAVFMFGGEGNEITTSSEPGVAQEPAPAPTVQPDRAPTAPTAPNAATDSLPSAREPEPQAATPDDTELRAEPASASRGRTDAPRAWESAPRAWEIAQRGERRERAQANAEPGARAEDLEQAPVRAEAEQPTVALSGAQDSVAKDAAVKEAPAWATRAQPTLAPVAPVVAIKPAVTQPNASRGTTRGAVAIERVAPRFPIRAKRMDIAQGVVTVELTVDKNGDVKDAVVVSAQPERVFDEAALKAIRQWKYQPKLVNGTPTESRQRFTFRFE